MSSVPSASTWGPPTATKHALLIHGLTSSSHTWRRVASSLAAKGYLVTAPNLVGHGLRAATDYRISAIAQDLRPYLEARNYTLIIGHSVGALTALALSAYLPPSQPTAIVLIDPPMQISPEMVTFYDKAFAEACTNPKPADAYSTEHPLWEREDYVLRELSTRLCTADTVHGVFGQNKPWSFFDQLSGTEKWKVTTLIADPEIIVLCPIEGLRPYPHVRHVVVSGSGHWIHNDFPNVVVEEALKTVAELETA